MRLALRLTAVLPIFLLAACDEFSFGDSERFQEDFHYTYPLASDGRISLETMNGSVEISTWDNDSVEITGTKYASSQQGAKDIKIEVSAAPARIQIRTVVAGGQRNVGARYALHVPRHVQLDPVTSSNGSIRIEDVKGQVNARSSNGSIRVNRLKGPLDAETTNGSIEVSGQTGRTTLRTSNGGIRVEINQGALAASTSNGRINAQIAKSDALQPVRLESSNGRIDLSLDAVREVRANTSNSSIVVHLPESAGAQIRARTSNSSITTDFTELSPRVTAKHSLEGTLGSGGPLIDLSTSNGSIKLLKL